MNDSKTRPTLYLVDGPNMAFRAFFAIGGMSNSQGLPTNALFGFTKSLLKLIREERPDYLAITWDPKGGTFRDRIYPDYKGTAPTCRRPCAPRCRTSPGWRRLSPSPTCASTNSRPTTWVLGPQFRSCGPVATGLRTRH